MTFNFRSTSASRVSRASMAFCVLLVTDFQQSAQAAVDPAPEITVPSPPSVTGPDLAGAPAGSPSAVAPAAATPIASSPTVPPPGTPSEDRLPEVTVTGQKRSSTVQKTSASIDVIDGSQIEQKGDPDIASLIQSTAGVSLKTEGVGQTEIEMRGMTSSGGSSPTTGFYLDDIPLTPPAGAQNGKGVISPSLYDMQGVEILRGPQGTLYGSGSMGGTVKLITNQPDLNGFGASMQSILSSTEGGGFNHSNNLMLNIPLIDDAMALRLVVSEDATSGWIDRIVANPFPIVTNSGATRGSVMGAPVVNDYHDSNSAQQYNIRSSVLWRLTPQLTITPSIDYLTSHQDGISAYDSTPGTLAHYQPFDIAEPLNDHIIIGSLTAKYSFEKTDLTWNTSYWNRRSTQVEDGSEDFNNPDSGATLASNKNPTGPQPGYYGPHGTGTVVGTEDDPSRQISTELRIASKGNGPFQWVAGAYASDYWATWNFSGITANPGVYMDLGTTQAATTNQWFVAHSPTNTTQMAVFGDGTYALDDHWKIEVGARLFHYNYDFSSTITGWGSGLGAATPSSSGQITEEVTAIVPKLGLSFELNPDMMVYTDVSKGERPAGGNAAYPTTGVFWGPAYAPFHYTSGWPLSYNSDDVLSYEVGEKARLFDRRLTLDASIFYENWQHPQLLAYPGDWAFNINGNKATIMGADLSASAILGGGFTFSAEVGYTHDTVDPGPHWEISPANVMPDVPLFNASLSLTWKKSLSEGRTLIAEIDNSFVGARYSLNFLYPYQSTGEYMQLPSYDLTNLRLTMQSRNGWKVGLFVNNAFNKHAALENLFQETEPSAAFSRILTNQPLTAGLNLSYEM